MKPENIESLKEQIKKASSQEEAIDILNEYISAHPESDEAYTMRGMKYWGLGQRAEALNDYLEAIRLNPQSRARLALQASEEILDYRNKDLYNP